MTKDALLDTLKNSLFHPVMDEITTEQPPLILDLSNSNKEIQQIDLNEESSFTNYIFNTIRSSGCAYGIGGYGEDRIIYSRSDVFGTARTIHLGIDIWTNAGSSVYSPMEGEVHSFANNDNHGDYGPTIIIRHLIEGEVFFTLYGHLSRTSLDGLTRGKKVSKGEKIATLGAYEENVHWPPHLHFQVIRDLGGKEGDYPGVCARSEKEYYLFNCPDPNLILKMPVLE